MMEGMELIVIVIFEVQILKGKEEIGIGESLKEILGDDRDMKVMVMREISMKREMMEILIGDQIGI